MPLPITELSKKTEAFKELHKDCKPTWKEPKPDPSLNETQRADWWIEHGEIGLSSRTIWTRLTGRPVFEVNHPHDPDDFERCHKLLEAVPEWKTQLDKLRTLSPQWNNLVEKWHVLTELYLQQIKTKEDNGMYEFMQRLIR